MAFLADAKIKALRVWQHTSILVALVAGICMLVMLALVVVEVWTRYVMHNPIPWAFEVTELLFLVIVFLGLGYTTRINAHPSVDVITMHLGQRKRARLNVITSIVASGVTAIIFWQLADVLTSSFVQQWYTTTTVPVIMWPFIATAPVGCLLMFLECVNRIVISWRESRGPVV